MLEIIACELNHLLAILSFVCCKIGETLQGNTHTQECCLVIWRREMCRDILKLLMRYEGLKQMGCVEVWRIAPMPECKSMLHRSRLGVGRPGEGFVQFVKPSVNMDSRACAKKLYSSKSE